MNNNTNSTTTLTIADQLKEAINNAKSIRLRPEMDYFESCCRQRTPGDKLHAGSVFDLDFIGVSHNEGAQADWTQVQNALFGSSLVNWKEYPECPNLMPGCKAYRFDAFCVVGYVGVRNLKDLDPSEMVTIDDRKNTGTASVTTFADYGEHNATTFAVAIVGDEGGKPTLFTVHPGDPVAVSNVKIGGKLHHGDRITVREALALGFETAKMV